jgi:hypothetical protein
VSPKNRPEITAACYVRVSTDEQRESGVSLSVQESECKAKAAALGASDRKSVV